MITMRYSTDAEKLGNEVSGGHFDLSRKGKKKRFCEYTGVMRIGTYVTWGGDEMGEF